MQFPKHSIKEYVGSINIEWGIKSFYFTLAASFIVFSLGKELDVTFRSASYALVAIILAQLAFISLKIATKIRSEHKLNDHPENIWLIILSTVNGLITSSINRPDIDDSVYAPKAVFYTENPDALLGSSITWLAGLPEGADSFVFQYYEILQATLAWFIGFKFLTIYHVFFPFLIGFLSFFSIYLLLGLFYSEFRIKLAGAVFFVLLMLLLGETHRTYGNVSIARAFHGKFVLFYLGFYNWTYFSIKYFDERKLGQVVFLAIAGVALTALSTTALFYIPILSLIIYLSFLGSRGDLFAENSIKVGIGYFLALLPLAVLALNFRSVALRVMPAGNSVNSGFSSDFSGQISFFINADFPVTPVIFLCSLLFIFLFSEYRKFFGLWVLYAFILVLNPFVSSFFIKNVTTENAYWRLFYLLPFPLITVIAFCSYINQVYKFKIVVCITFFTMVVFIFTSPSSVLRRGNSAYFEFLQYKIHEPTRSFVQKLEKTLPPGTCLGPIEVASNLVIYSSKFPQYYIREDYLNLVVEKYLSEAHALDRRNAASYLYSSSTSPDAKSSFHRLINLSRPNYVILNSHIANTSDAINFLSSKGYSEIDLSDSEYKLWGK